MESARPRPRLHSISLCAALVLTVGASTANADRKSGPNNRTLHHAVWGSIYYPVSGAQPVQLTHGVEGARLSRGASQTTVEARFGGSYEIRHKKSKATVTERRGGGLEIRSGDRVVAFQPTDRGLQVTTPDDRIRYERTADGFVVTGTAGQTRFLRGASTYELRSSRGITRFNVQSGGDVDSLGVPATAHPYIGRAVYVTLGDAGVHVDVWHLARLDRILTSLVPWQAALSLSLDEQTARGPTAPPTPPKKK